MLIASMSFCQHRFKSIDLIQCKYIRLNLIDALQHIHKPSTGLKPFCIQPVCRPHLMQYSIPANFHAILYYCNSSLYRNFIKQNITPTQPARLALVPRGFLFSTIRGTKKCLGTIQK